MAKIKFNFENESPTFNPPSVRRGALNKLSDTKSGLTITIKRGGSSFDIVSNTGGQKKNPAFGKRSLDPFVRQTDSTPFTVNFSKRVYSVSVAMGDYGDDNNDTLSLAAYSKKNGKGRLLNSNTETLASNGTTFVSKVVTLKSRSPIRSIKMIGGTPEFSNSVFYDNLVVDTKRPSFVDNTPTLSVLGTDAIFLAGRTDVTIPPLGSTSPTFPLVRYTSPSSRFLQETFPKSVSAHSGQTFTFEVAGSIDFYDGRSRLTPDGDTSNSSDLFGVGGISGYQGKGGALVGVFLTDANPASGVTPGTLNFTSTLGTAFTSLTPEIGQVFFIGDGQTGTGSGETQKFTAPTGATRLFLGIPDGYSFDGQPGFYEDNDGSYEVKISSP